MKVKWNWKDCFFSTDEQLLKIQLALGGAVLALSVLLLVLLSAYIR